MDDNNDDQDGDENITWASPSSAHGASGSVTYLFTPMIAKLYT